MNKAQWQMLQAAFAEATALSGEERESFLTQFSADHPELATTLRELIDSEDDETRFGDVIAAKAADLTDAPSDDAWLNRTLGPWRIVERIAGGGMGAVFLAERADREYAQTAAIKVMATQLLAPEAVARFRAERQILANLKHPYIAGLLDGGATDDGLPYIVMEYVDGSPIDTYCQEADLDVDARLALFRKVCEAVDYAHRNLVVHRDLKPNNILIDKEGNPKLLDFGIAKLIDAKGFQQSVTDTRPGVFAMTPEYASPEQVRGEPVSVASDVYALGVLLFRLLTGQSPYAGDLTTPGSYERAILESEPRRPSTAVTVSTKTTEAQADSRFSTEQLRRLLIGDLDNITMRALQKAPERRYASVADFSRDIARHQRHEPIEARADDWWYRSRKFLRRHAARVAVAAAVLAAVVGLVTFYTLRLADERDRANLSAAEAQQVAEFLTSLFEGASPNVQAGKEVTAVDLLEQGREQIDALEDQPELQAQLMQIMASSSTSLGRYDVSIPMLERALELQESLTPVDRYAVSLTTNTLTAAHRQNGDLEQAEYYQRRTLELATEVFGEAHYNVAYLKMRLGVVLFDRGRVEESLALKQEALEQLVAMGSGDSTAALDARGNIVVALSRLGRLEEATALAGEVATLSVEVQGQDHPNTIIRITNHANNLGLLGKLNPALALLDENIPRGIAVWGREHYHVVYMQQVRGGIKRRLGDFEGALDDYSEAQDSVIRFTDEDNYRRGDALRGLGATFLAMRRLDDARDAFERALVNAEVADGGAQRVPQAQYWLGRVAFAAGDLTASRQWYDEAVTRAELMSATSQLALTTGRIETLTALGEFDSAAPLVGEVVGLDDSVAHLDALAAATGYYRARGDCEKATSTGARIQTIIEASAQPMVWGDALALGEHGLALSECGQPGAGQTLTAATEVLGAVLGPDDHRVQRLRGLCRNAACH